MRRRWGIVGALGLVAAGCSEPDQIVPVAPPGVELVRMPPVPEGGGAQALGEQGARPSPEPVKPATPAVTYNAPPTKPGETATTATGLKYQTIKPGTGSEAKTGTTVSVHYTGTFEDGKKFDSSRDQGQPISVLLGSRQVIAGWEQGIPGMKVGEIRKLIIPAELAYGAQGKGEKIPPNTPLLFEVELVAVN